MAKRPSKRLIESNRIETVDYDNGDKYEGTLQGSLRTGKGSALLTFRHLYICQRW